MKIRLISAILLFLLIFTNLFSETAYDWNVTREGGEYHGIWPFRWVGYEYVSQEPSTKTLTCTGKGIHECELFGVEIPDCVISHTNDMIEYADLQVMDSVYTGTYVNNYYCGGQYYLSSITWQTDSSGVSTYQVTNTPVTIP